MIFFAFCSLVALAFIGLHVAMRKHKWIKCALYGHEGPMMEKVKIGGDLKWHCTRCHRSVVL